MNKESRIFVAGHRGLVGSALLRKLQSTGFANLITRDRAELDLVDQGAVKQFFDDQSPEYVFLAAAKVGGIHANSTYPEPGGRSTDPSFTGPTTGSISSRIPGTASSGGASSSFA